MVKANSPLKTSDPQDKIAHLAIILDRSGSMESCRDETISGFNEYTQQIRSTSKAAGLDARLSLTVFNPEVRMPLFGAPLKQLHAMDRKHYVPDGATAMLDAVGQTIKRLEKDAAEIDVASVLVCIISDGLENASREYTYADIAEHIQRLTATKRWTFTYLGSNQDLSQISQHLNIPMANTSSYVASRHGSRNLGCRRTSAPRAFTCTKRGVPTGRCRRDSSRESSCRGRMNRPG
jgi:hypothetical protein